jgi:transcription elongation factor Elf1
MKNQLTPEQEAMAAMQAGQYTDEVDYRQHEQRFINDRTRNILVCPHCGAHVDCDESFETIGYTLKSDWVATVQCKSCGAALRLTINLVSISDYDEAVDDDPWDDNDEFDLYDDGENDDNIYMDDYDGPSEEEMSEPLNYSPPEPSTSCTHHPCDAAPHICPYDITTPNGCIYWCNIDKRQL